MIYEDLSFSDYLNLPGWNWSKIKILKDGSPAHVQHAIRTADNDTASRGFLRAVHGLVLEPHVFDRDFIVYQGKRDKRTKAYQAHLAEHGDKTTLTEGEFNGARATARAILAHPAAQTVMGYRDEGRPELTMTWTDDVTGLPLKGRIDWLSPHAFVDLKTIGSTEAGHVARLVAKNLYHGQCAHYDAGLRAHGIEVPAYIVAAEGKGAQDVGVFHIDEGVPDGALHVGRVMRRRLLAQLAECVESGEWPGRCGTVQTLALPSFALDEELDAITF